MDSGLRGFSSDRITPEMRRSPKVRAALITQFRGTMLFAVVSLIPTASALVAVFWQVSSHRGLMAFFVAVTTGAAIHWFGYLRHPAESTRMRWINVAQVWGGISWGLLPVLAMPRYDEWQVFIAAFLLGVLAANAVFGAQFASSANLFPIALTIPAAGAFLSVGTDIGLASALLILCAAPYAMILSWLTRISYVAANLLAVENADLVEGLSAERAQLDSLARTDGLTSLANRFHFGQQLGQMLNRESPETVGLAFLDLDGFKQINDALGHRVGDMVLKAVADRLTARLDPGEVLARIGGDELAVISPTLADRDQDTFGERFLRAFAEPFTVGRRTVTVGVSIGVAFSHGHTDPSSLLHAADMAVYRAKAHGGRQIVIFDDEMAADAATRDDLLRRYAAAFEDGRIVPWLQPIVDLRTGRIVGAEALVRWEHLDGSLNAEAFLEVVSELGLGEQLDAHVLTSVSRYLPEVRTVDPELSISVNVGPEHLAALLRRRDVRQALPGIALEITEHHALPEHEASSLLDDARSLGARVLLDDFGVGYSTLARLAEVAVDGIKIDRQFVKNFEDPTQTAIIAALVELSNRMGYQLIAEGIETEAQRDALLQLGVRRAQGYLFSPAVPIPTFLNMIRAEARTSAQV